MFTPDRRILNATSACPSPCTILFPQLVLVDGKCHVSTANIKERCKSYYACSDGGFQPLSYLQTVYRVDSIRVVCEGGL